MKARVFFKGVAVMAVMAIAFVVYCNVRIGSYAKSRVFDSLDELPHCHTALVLGTSPKGRFGGPNRFFIARINAAAELFEAGKVERILVSGDNRHANYNEPEAMKQALVEKGIPADVIFLDYAGFRTFDSVVRAREVFGQDSFVVVSQKFHNERAVFIAGKKGTEAIGYNAQDVSLRSGGVLTHVREWGARCKVFLDILTGKKPHFLRTDAGDISWHCHQQL